VQLEGALAAEVVTRRKRKGEVNWEAHVPHNDDDMYIHEHELSPKGLLVLPKGEGEAKGPEPGG